MYNFLFLNGEIMNDKIIPGTGIAQAIAKELNIPDPIKTSVAKLLENTDDTRADKDNKEGN